MAHGQGVLEATDRGCFCIVNIKNGQQLGQLHDLVEFFAQMAEAHVCTLILGVEMRRDQSAQPRAVDVCDVGQVQNDLLFSFRDQLLSFSRRELLSSPSSSRAGASRTMT